MELCKTPRCWGSNKEAYGMKLYLIRRRVFTVGLCLLAAAAMLYVVNHPAIVGASATTRQLPIYCVARDQKVASLTFDAAWGDVR